MNKIPLSVSSTLVSAVSPSAVEVTPYANNTGKTGTAAPVLIAVQSEGTVDAAAFAAALPARGGQGTAAQARLIVNALAEVLSDLVAEYGAITVGTPIGMIETFIAGSLEYATDPVDPEANYAFLGIVPGADVMKTFAKMEAYVPQTACPASLKRIRDVATSDNRIYGTAPFYAQGYGLTYGGTGETVKLLNPLTRAVVTTLTVDSLTKSDVQLKCTLPAGTAVPVGTYILQVTTLAGGSLTLWPLELKVNVAVAVVPPQHAAMTNVRSSAEDPADDLSIADTVDLTFDKADPLSGVGKLEVNGTLQDRPVTVSGTTATVEWTWGREELIGQQVTIKFKFNDGTYSGQVTKTIRAERE